MRTEILKAMQDIAEEKLSRDYVAVAGKLTIEVKNFGRGNRFAIQRNGDGKLHATIYFHSSNSRGHFSETVDQLGEAAARILAERVSIKKETLRRLAAGHSLSPEEQEEIARLLAD